MRFVLMLGILAIAEVTVPPALITARIGLHLRAQQTSPVIVLASASQIEHREGVGQIRGRVLAAPSGAPVAGARVMMRFESVRTSSNQMTAITDALGRYEFNDVQPGRYLLVPSGPGIAAPGYGLDPVENAGRVVEVSANRREVTLDLHVQTSASLYVRVTDDRGDPMAEVPVYLEAVVNSTGARRLIPSGGWGYTDDRGVVSLTNVPAGEYYVSASFVQQRGLVRVGSNADGPALVSTYYPGTISLLEAPMVSVQAGQHLALTIPLAAAPLARVSGTVVDSEGRPLSGGVVTMNARSAASLPTGPSRAIALPPTLVLKNGIFELGPVVPGEYVLSIETKVDGGTERVSLPLSIAGVDVTDIQLRTSPPATMRGRIIFEGGAPNWMAAGLARMRVEVVEKFVMAMSTRPMNVHPEWTFEVSGLYGLGIVRGTPSPGWMIKSVTIDRKNVFEQLVELERPLEDIEIVVTDKSATLSGNVSGRMEGTPVVVLFTTDRARWTMGSSLIRAVRIDQDGHYSIQNLLEGDYLAIALEELRTGEEFDTEVLSRLATRAHRVSLRNGLQTVDLRLEELPQ